MDQIVSLRIFSYLSQEGKLKKSKRPLFLLAIILSVVTELGNCVYDTVFAVTKINRNESG